MLLTTDVYVPNCLLVVVTSDDAVNPDFNGDESVEATDTALLVRSECAADSDYIELTVTDEVDAGVAMTPFLLYDGGMTAECGEVRPESVDREQFLVLPVASRKIRVGVWGHHPDAPYALQIQIVAVPGSQSSQR